MAPLPNKPAEVVQRGPGLASDAPPSNPGHITPPTTDDQDPLPVLEGRPITHDGRSAVTMPNEADIAPTKQSKRELKPLSKNRGTGFEEYFADPPMTPDEAAEEKEDIYSPNRPFVERIEECIQRYRARRRLTHERIAFFNKYLFLGGVDCTPRQFQGMGGYDIADLTKAEMHQIQAIDMIHQPSTAGGQYYTPNSEHWDVDFAGVAAGFLSEALPRMTGGEFKQMGCAVELVKNFLKYILHHEVCPEYEANVKEALEVCERAKVELPLSYGCLAEFPGQFNLAAQELYCKDDVALVACSNGFSRPDGFDPEVVFNTAVVLAGEAVLYERLQHAESVHVVDEVDCHMEVVSIHRPTPEVAKIFRYVNSDTSPDLKLAPIGKAILKPCQIQDGWDYTDLWSGPTFLKGEQTFFLDDEILVRMRPGFKLSMTVCLLNIGVKFIKQVMSVRPSFYTFLPQELMVGYKRPMLNERPGPTVENPDTEERDWE